ncbi:MAG: U32 family peptidase [Fusobacterium sp.]|nr:U32 family peptidase [Fusobacterium sp.]
MKIVAPAGNMERFYSAIKATADEIYLGLKGYGARRNAKNFTMEEVKTAIDYAHTRGTRIFLTLNTIMSNSEIETLYDKIKVLYEYGLDAIIVQDIGLAKYIHENFPDIEIHGSTQMTIGNYYEINFLKTLGFKRIVLARELSFEEIKEIRENTDMELEVFVSGALCISISGNCYMSSFIGGRSGNRGMCAQPCRKEYKGSCGEKSYFLSPKDQLYGLEEIKKLKEIGVESIKVEGRMKDVTYVYETVSYFRNLIEENETEENTSKIFNRGYSKGYFYGTNRNIMNKDYSYNIGEKVGEIKKGELKLETSLICGDGLSFLSKDYKVLGGTNLSRIDIKGVKENRKEASIGEIIKMDYPMGTKFIYKNFNKTINDEVAKNLKITDKKLEIYGEFSARLGEKIKFSLKEKNISVEIEGQSIVELAKNKSLSVDEIKEKLSAVGDSEFIIRDIEIKKDENIFLPLSELKNIKREAVEKFREKLILSFRRKLGGDSVPLGLSPSLVGATPPNPASLNASRTLVCGEPKEETTRAINKEETLLNLNDRKEETTRAINKEETLLNLNDRKEETTRAINKEETLLNLNDRKEELVLKGESDAPASLNASRTLVRGEPKEELAIDILVNNSEQKDFIESQKEKYNISNIYFRTYDMAKQSKLSQHNLENPLASNFYELLENKNEKVMLNWNMNIVNSYSMKVLEKIEKLDSFIISPEISFSKIKTLGNTRLQKSLLVYSKLKGMTIDVDLSSEKVISNEQGDNFFITKNNYGTEIFLEKPLNIINIMEDIKSLGVDRVVLEFTNESQEEIEKVLLQLKSKKGEYREYNYKRGVY